MSRSRWDRTSVVLAALLTTIGVALAAMALIIRSIGS